MKTNLLSYLTLAIVVATAEMLGRVMTQPSMSASRPPAIDSTGLSEPLTQVLKPS